MIIKGKYENRSQVLVIRSEETGETREITLGINCYRPILSPDGSRFAVSGGDGKNFGVFLIDSDSGVVNLFVKIPTENTAIDPCPNWSPDGTSIYYKLRSPDDNDEYIIRCKDIITGEEKEIFRGFNTRDIKLSPDGTKFAYFTNDKPTKSYIMGILDIKTGSKLELLHIPETDCLGISTPIWTMDGKYILVAKDINKGSELWRYLSGGGPGEKLYSSPFKSWAFVMHPSSNKIAFMQNRYNYEVWVLENFLQK
jgi:Tol biopolymer transport system component